MSRKLHQIFPRMLSVAVARCSSGGVAIRYVLPVSCLHIIDRHSTGDAKRSYAQSDSSLGSNSDIYDYLVGSLMLLRYVGEL